MKLESYQIPESYQSYLETFETDPGRAISRLEARIEKRNSGAIGYFFLAWMHYKNNDIEKSLDAALEAKTRAPGSRFMDRLPYFIAHPHAFNAWQPKEARTEFKRDIRHYDQAHPIQDLDLLITKLSSIETTRIKLNLDAVSEPEDLSIKSADVDDIVTETLAVIHEKQGNLILAMRTYQRLMDLKPAKETYYLEHIERLRKKSEGM